jgi:hypothetical protein
LVFLIKFLITLKVGGSYFLHILFSHWSYNKSFNFYVFLVLGIDWTLLFGYVFVF